MNQNFKLCSNASIFHCKNHNVNCELCGYFINNNATIAYNNYSPITISYEDIVKEELKELKELVKKLQEDINNGK